MSQLQVDRPGSFGFSLIELLVVVAILGLALTLTAPRLATVIESAQVKSAARELAAGLRDARSRAVVLQQETTLGLDVETNTYRVEKANSVLDLPEGTTLTLTTARSEQQSESQGTIRFFADGSSTGGRIELTAETGDYVIDVNWLTGQIAISP